MKVELVCFLVSLVVFCSPSSSAQSQKPEVVSGEVSVHLVGRAYTPELEELLREWFAAQGQSVQIARQPSVALEHLLEASDASEVRSWLVLPNGGRARLYFADTQSRRFFVRDVPLDNGLDELGREKLAQVVVAAVQAFAERRVQDTPLESVKQALAENAENAESKPEPEAAAAASAGALEPTHPQQSAPSAAPVADAEQPSSSAQAWSWAVAANYHAVYRGPEGWAHGPGLQLEGWFASQDIALGLSAGGRYELPHTVSAQSVELGLQTSALRFGVLLATVGEARPRWMLGVGAGWDWFRFRPSGGSDEVLLREAERARRALVQVSLGRFVNLDALRLGLIASVDIALVKSHYDLSIAGNVRRELTPWQAHPNLALQIAWH